MTKKMVVRKDNALMNAAYTLTLAEQRLILLSVAVANGSAAELKCMAIPTALYAEKFGVTRQAAYSALHDAAGQLFERRFSYQRMTEKGNIAQVHSRWVQSIQYVEAEAEVHVRFSDDVVPLLCELEKRFTQYALDAITCLTSVHAVRLYELLIAWRSIGQTPVFELSEFRQRLGIEPSEYRRMNDFKKRVLDAAIKQINEHTDITASYEQHKRGRSITGFSFSLQFKLSEKAVKARKPKPTKAGKNAEKGARFGVQEAAIKAGRKPGEGYEDAALRILEESKRSA